MKTLDIPIVCELAQEYAHPLCLLTPCERPDEVRTIIAGHSNAGSIARALIARDKGSKAPQAIETARRLGLAALRGAPVSPSYLEILERLGRSHNIVIVWMGNQANGDFLLNAGRPFDVIPRDYGDDSIVQGAQVVAESMIRAQFLPSLAGLHAFLKALGQTSLRRIVLGSHPPLESETFIRGRFHREPHFEAVAKGFGVGLAGAGVMPASVRRKLWFILTGLYREAAARHGATFVEAPPAAQCPRGFLKPELGAGDITHASTAYGRLAVAHIANALEN